MSDRLAAAGRLGRWCINLLWAASCLACAAVLIWGAIRVEIADLSVISGLVFFGIPLAILALLLGSLLSSSPFRAVLTLTIIFAAIGVYGAQAYSINQRKAEVSAGKMRAAERLGVPYDERSLLDVVVDKRAKGDSVYPIILSHFESQIGAPGKAVIPLSGISRVDTVFCNERGYFEMYLSDRYGLNNPDHVWDNQPIDIALIGDSFAHGYCVPRDQTLSGQLRKSVPATVNLGVGSRGPLVELAMLSEYAARLRPRVVLWTYTECNDLDNLIYEARNPRLLQYLEDSTHSQNLIDRQADVDAALKTYFRSITARQFGFPAFRLKRAADIILLRKLRDRLNLRLRSNDDGPAGAPAAAHALPLLERILAEAQRRTQAWGGRFVLVYLPSYYRTKNMDQACLSNREAVMSIATARKIQTVDLSASLPGNAIAVDDLWYYPGSHYTAEGYQLAAAEILRQFGGLAPKAETATSGNAK